MILVTGGAGYIGSHTAVELLQAGYEVVIADSFINSSDTSLKHIESISGKKFFFEEIDIQSRRKVDALFEKYDFDTVIHFAAFKSVGESVQEPLMYYENNLGSLVSLLRACQKHKVENFIFSSSCTVYGVDAEGEISESSGTSPCASPYGNTKKISEEIISDFARANDFKAVILRYFNPIGAHESGLLGDEPKGVPNNLLPYLTRVVDGELEELQVFGGDYDTPDGTCIRDYIHVVDVAIAHVNAIDYLKELDQNQVEVINLGTGKGSSVLEVIEAFEAATSLKVKYRIAPRRDGDLPKIYANADKAKKTINWVAERSLKEMLSSAWKFQKTSR